MTFLSYDIEIATDLLEGHQTLDGIVPSVAATCTNKDDLQYWYDLPVMTPETARGLVTFMMEQYQKGIIPFTWNGTDFDWKLLGQYSGMVNECSELALNSVDGMLLVTFQKGFFLGLDTALSGAGLESKTHEVMLNDKTMFSEMTGSMAPQMWRAGEYEAVKTYLAGDVFRPLELISVIEKNHGIKWISKAGKLNFVWTGLTPVKDLFKLVLPDTSWMASKPKPRSDFVSWMPPEILEKYNINP
jgi:hypothetical protein